MAEGSAPPTPPAGAGGDERPVLQNQISQQDIGEQAAILLRHFIADRFEREGVENAPSREQIIGNTQEGDSEVWIQIGSTLRQIGDILDQDQELQRAIRLVPEDSPIEAILAVAVVLFSDGQISWGRIVGLFYFTYKMCLKLSFEVIPDKYQVNLLTTSSRLTFHLARLIDTVPDESPIEAIIAVAQVIFGDGDINWGRIIGVFYFAYRMCVKALDRMMREQFPGWINQLIREMVKFLVVRFADWIINRGGWQAVREYFGSTPPAVWNTLSLMSLVCLLYGWYRYGK